MAAAIDNILNFKRDEEDFYAILGCDENSSVSKHFSFRNPLAWVRFLLYDDTT